MKKEMKSLTRRMDILANGQKVTYRGRVYWMNLVTDDIYCHSVDEEILGSISGYKIGVVIDGKAYKTETPQNKDGWKVISGYEVYIEDGKVLRGISSRNTTVYPYRRCRHGGWDNVSGLSMAAFRSGVRRGTIEMK